MVGLFFYLAAVLMAQLLMAEFLLETVALMKMALVLMVKWDRHRHTILPMRSSTRSNSLLIVIKIS